MELDENEEKLLRSVALQNARAVLLARERAELALIESHQALLQKTAELAQQRESFQVTLSSIGDAVITTDIEARVTFLNPVAEKMTGWNSREAIGHPLTQVFNIINERTREPAMNPVAKVLRDGGVVGLANHTALIARDGSEQAIDDSAAPIRDAAGKICGVVMVFHEVTQQRRAESALLENRERLQAALNAASTGTFRWTIPTNALEWDENLDRLFGLPANQTICSLENFIATVHPEDRAGVIELCRRCAGEGIDFDREFRVIWPDDSVHWLHDTGKMFFDSAGRPAHMTGACLDITRHKQGEKNLSDTAQRLHLALDAGDLGDWSWDARTEILTLSERGSEIFGQGKSPTFWSWDGVRALLHPDDRERAKAASQQGLKTHSDYKIEYRLNHPTAGLRWIATRGRGIYGPDGEILGMVGVVQDVTEQKRAAESLSDARHELAQQNQILEKTVRQRTARLQEIILELEAFSYSISHDMRAPLRAIKGYSDALLKDYEGKFDADADNYLQRMNRAALRLDSLIRDVLAYSRIAKEDVSLKAVNVETLIADIVQTYPNLHPSKISVIVSPLAPVIGHEALLTQIISNLLGNSVKFAVAGVTPEVRVSAEIMETEVRLWFQDNGVGIDPHHHQQIFQIFGRVYPDKTYEGTGIGLAIVKKAVERMGGSVGVESELGKGSSFWIVLKKARS